MVSRKFAKPYKTHPFASQPKNTQNTNENLRMNDDCQMMEYFMELCDLMIGELIESMIYGPISCFFVTAQSSETTVNLALTNDEKRQYRHFFDTNMRLAHFC